MTNNSGKTLKVVYDPLTELMAYYADKKGEKKEKAARAGTVEERLKKALEQFLVTVK